MTKHKTDDYKNSAVKYYLNNENGCGYWNRDTNGATNIYRIASNAIHNKARPSYLSRSNSNSTGLDESVKSKFT